MPDDILKFFKETGAKGGKIGGKRSLETMTPAERTARAKKAAAASALVRSKKLKTAAAKIGSKRGGKGKRG